MNEELWSATDSDGSLVNFIVFAPKNLQFDEEQINVWIQIDF